MSNSNSFLDELKKFGTEVLQTAVDAGLERVKETVGETAAKASSKIDEVRARVRSAGQTRRSRDDDAEVVGEPARRRRQPR